MPIKSMAFVDKDEACPEGMRFYQNLYRWPGTKKGIVTSKKYQYGGDFLLVTEDLDEDGDIVEPTEPVWLSYWKGGKFCMETYKEDDFYLSVQEESCE